MFSKKPSPTELYRSRGLQELVKRSRLVLVEDQVATFPLEELRQAGFSIDHWPDVDNKGLQRLESGDFDVIILDIGGIGETVAGSDQGVGVFSRLVERCPWQLIIVNTAHTYDAKAMDRLRHAFCILPKTTPLTEWKRTLETVIYDNLGPDRYVNAIRRLLGGDREANALCDKIESVISKNRMQSWEQVEGKIRSLLPKVDDVATVLVLAKKALYLLVP